MHEQNRRSHEEKEGARDKMNGQSPKQVEKHTNKNMKKIRDINRNRTGGQTDML